MASASALRGNFEKGAVRSAAQCSALQITVPALRHAGRGGSGLAMNGINKDDVVARPILGGLHHEYNWKRVAA